ncbi:MAG: ATP-binding protein [Rubrivivax sp.]|nr:MAG: ATP-binding protein [Rubrivivax sp.]
MNSVRLYLVCGLPGAGKTTRSKAIVDATKAIRLCTDEWLEALGISLVDYPPRFRFEPHLLQHAEQLLGAGVSVIAEFATWSRRERDAIRDAARRCGAAAELHFVDAPLDELERRVRERGGPHAAILADEILRKLGHRFERPSDDEAATYDRYVGPDAPDFRGA